MKTSEQLINENKKLKFERDEAISDLSCNNEFFSDQLRKLNEANKRLKDESDIKTFLLVLFALVIIFV